MTDTADDGGLDVRPAITVPGSDLPTACLLSWQRRNWFADPGDVREAGIDMIECALVTRLMTVLMQRGAPGEVLGAMVSDMISRPGKKRFGNLATVVLQPVGNTETREAWVRVTRGDLAADAASDVMHATGSHWLEVASAVDSDRNVVAAMRAVDTPPGLETLLLAEIFEQRRKP